MGGGIACRSRRPRPSMKSLLLVPALLLFSQCAAERGAPPSPGAGQPPRGKIVFAANVKGNWDLFAVSADGTGLTQLTDTPLDERTPAISPDGGRLAYSTSDGALWVMPLDTKAAVALPLPAGRYGYPAWTGDGGGIIYTSYTFAPGNEDADFFVYSFADGRPRPALTQTGPQDYPAPSPRGDALAYVTSQATVLQGFGSTLTQQLWIASLTAGRPSQMLLGSRADTRPAWSPGGEWIAFSSERAGGPDLWMIRPDGRELTRLTESPAAETSPSWSPDGREIVYVSTESGRMKLMLLDVAARASRPLAPFGPDAAEAKDPSWR